MNKGLKKILRTLCFTILFCCAFTSSVSAEAGLTSAEGGKDFYLGINDLYLEGDILVMKGYSYQMYSNAFVAENYYHTKGSSHYYKLKVNGKTYSDTGNYYVDHTQLNHLANGAWQSFKDVGFEFRVPLKDHAPAVGGKIRLTFDLELNHISKTGSMHKDTIKNIHYLSNGSKTYESSNGFKAVVNPGGFAPLVWSGADSLYVRKGPNNGDPELRHQNNGFLYVDYYANSNYRVLETRFNNDRKVNYLNFNFYDPAHTSYRPDDKRYVYYAISPENANGRGVGRYNNTLRNGWFPDNFAIYKASVLQVDLYNNGATLNIIGDEGVERIEGNGTYTGGTTVPVKYHLKPGYALVKTTGTCYGSDATNCEWTTNAGQMGVISDSWVMSRNRTAYVHTKKVNMTNGITHWAFGFKNKEGENAARDAIKLQETSFEKTIGTNFTLSKTMGVRIPNGFEITNHIGTSSITGNWQYIPFSTVITQKPEKMWFQFDYHPTPYKITYNLNGGTNSSSNPSEYNVLYGIRLSNPTKVGYTFAGWVDSNGRKVTGINEGKNAQFSSAQHLYDELATRQTGNISLTATWTPNTYTVTYNGNGGKMPNGSTTWSNTATFNQSYFVEGKLFDRKGYTFTGWNTKPDGTGENWTKLMNQNYTWTDTKNITLYAQWRKDWYDIEYLGGQYAIGNKMPNSHFQTAENGNDHFENLSKNTYIKRGFVFGGWKKVGTK